MLRMCSRKSHVYDDAPNVRATDNTSRTDGVPSMMTRSCITDNVDVVSAGIGLVLHSESLNSLNCKDKKFASRPLSGWRGQIFSRGARPPWPPTGAGAA